MGNNTRESLVGRIQTSSDPPSVVRLRSQMEARDAIRQRLREVAEQQAAVFGLTPEDISPIIETHGIGYFRQVCNLAKTFEISFFDASTHLQEELSMIRGKQRDEQGYFSDETLTIATGRVSSRLRQPRLF